MILDEIVANKRLEVREREEQTPITMLSQRAAALPAPRPFEPIADVSLIAEVKRWSPSKGALAADLNLVTQAIAYEKGGASAVSVLTDSHFFGGTFADLAAIRARVKLPVLCKDFVLTQYQVVEARSHGADLVLLIVAALTDRELIELHSAILDLGMTALVEVHDQHELARALAIDARLIGINNRDLSDFSVDLLTTEYLAPLIPDDVIIVSESGIATREDVRRVTAAGARVVLVGEALVRSSDPRSTIRELLA